MKDVGPGLARSPPHSAVQCRRRNSPKARGTKNVPGGSHYGMQPHQFSAGAWCVFFMQHPRPSKRKRCINTIEVGTDRCPANASRSRPGPVGCRELTAPRSTWPNGGGPPEDLACIRALIGPLPD